MIIEKKICILDKEYDLTYRTYSDVKPRHGYNACRASLKLTFNSKHVVSLHVVALGYVRVNGKDRRTRLRSVLEAKVQFIKFLINDN